MSNENPKTEPTEAGMQERIRPIIENIDQRLEEITKEHPMAQGASILTLLLNTREELSEIAGE